MDREFPVCYYTFINKNKATPKKNINNNNKINIFKCDENSKTRRKRKWQISEILKTGDLKQNSCTLDRRQADPVTDARAVPIYATTSYVFHNSQHAADRFGLRDAGNIYGRLTNPTEDVFEQRIAALEGGSCSTGSCFRCSSDLTYTFQALAKTGEHIVASKTIYGGTYNLLAHTLPQTSGITTTFRRSG